jgi:hypothetical protein
VNHAGRCDPEHERVDDRLVVRDDDARPVGRDSLTSPDLDPVQEAEAGTNEELADRVVEDGLQMVILGEG